MPAVLGKYVMSCKEYIKQRYLAITHELSEMDRADFERHLDQCENCRREFAIYQQIVQNYHMLPTTTDLELQPETIMTRATRESSKKHHWGFSPNVWIPVAAAIFIVFGALFIPYIFEQFRPHIVQETSGFIDIFSDPSFFENVRETGDAELLTIRFSLQEEKTTVLAEKIASLRRPDDIALSFSSSLDRRIQSIKQQIHSLSEYEELHIYLPTDSLFRRNIL